MAIQKIKLTNNSGTTLFPQTVITQILNAEGTSAAAVAVQSDIDAAILGANDTASAYASSAYTSAVDYADSNFAKTDVTSALTTSLTTVSGTVSGLDSRLTTAQETISSIAGGITVQAVDTLPTENIKSNTIYMVPVSGGSASDNVRDEYMYINGAWQKIGSTEVQVDVSGKADLSGATFSGAVSVPTLTITSGATVETVPAEAADNTVVNKGYVNEAISSVQSQFQNSMLHYVVISQ